MQTCMRHHFGECVLVADSKQLLQVTSKTLLGWLWLRPGRRAAEAMLREQEGQRAAAAVGSRAVLQASA